MMTTTHVRPREDRTRKQPALDDRMVVAIIIIGGAISAWSLFASVLGLVMAPPQHADMAHWTAVGTAVAGALAGYWVAKGK